MQKNENKGRVWILTDTHLGCRANSTEWLSIVESAHFDFIIPTIEQNYKKGDIIIHCGDVFDNRTNLHLKVIELGLKIYKKLGDICPVHVICGNHDIYYKSNTETTSLDILTNLNNIHIYKDVTVLEYLSNNLLLMPWRKDVKEESETLDLHKECSYAFMHGTFALTKYNKYVDISEGEGVSLKSVQHFKRVYSGHIHWSQQFNNVNVVGTPYQITRGDSGNPKGIFLLDLATNEQTFFENEISPKFLQFSIDSINKEKILEIRKLCVDNFVDININENLLLENSAKLTKLFYKIGESARALNIYPVTQKIEEGLQNIDNSTDVKEIVYTELNNRFANESLYKAKNIIDELFKLV